MGQCQRFTRSKKNKKTGGVMFVLVGTKHSFLIEAIHHGPEGEILNVVTKIVTSHAKTFLKVSMQTAKCMDR